VERGGALIGGFNDLVCDVGSDGRSISILRQFSASIVERSRHISERGLIEMQYRFSSGRRRWHGRATMRRVNGTPILSASKHRDAEGK
jgi:hypothetical protein